jgi:hypothetical protein
MRLLAYTTQCIAHRRRVFWGRQPNLKGWFTKKTLPQMEITLKNRIVFVNPAERVLT